MANHEVLLLKPVDGLGAEGDQVKVRAGYARNFLLPQGMAVPLTGANRKRVEALKRAAASARPRSSTAPRRSPSRSRRRASPSP